MGAVLTITDSDTTGRSGIQADLETIASLKCHPTSAITAITSRSTNGQAVLYPIPHEHIATQITSSLTQFAPKAVKVGALYDVDSVWTVAKALAPEKETHPIIVCDPVCVSASGRTLPNSVVTEALVEALFPLTKIITLDTPQAEHLLSQRGSSSKISSLGDMIATARNLLQYGSPAVLLKGGNLAFNSENLAALSQERSEVEVIPVNFPSDNMEILRVHSGMSDTGRVVDVLCDAKQVVLFVTPCVEHRDEDQMGSTLSAALTSQLACGFSLKEAVKNAVAYTHLATTSTDAADREHDRRTINHFHASVQRVIPQLTQSNRYPFTQRLIEGDAVQWKAYVEHDFVKQLGQGTLERKAFEHFIKQDYKYLTYYARAQALLAAKSTSFQSIRDAIQPIMNVLQEIETHKAFARTYDITEADLDNEPEAVTTTAYGAYLIDIGTQGDTTKLLMALLACLLGYGEVGLWLKKEASLPNSWVKTENNPYKRWMDDMAGEMYQNAVKVGLEIIESRAVADPPSPARFAEWEQVWKSCTKFEKGFWDAAMAAARV